MIMKVHSYVSTNGYLHGVDKQAQSALKELHRLAEQSDGTWEATIASAKENRARLDDAAASVSTASSVGTGTPTVPDGATATYIDPVAALALRERMNLPTSNSPMKNSATGDSPRAPPPPPLNILSAVPASMTGSSTLSTPDGVPNGKLETTGTNIIDPLVSKAAVPHVLCDHPDEKIASLAREYSEMESELVSTGPEYVRWPQNVTWKNFAVYQLIPTLVYELEYPRTDRCVPVSFSQPQRI